MSTEKRLYLGRVLGMEWYEMPGAQLGYPVAPVPLGRLGVLRAFWGALGRTLGLGRY